jgi:nicotinate phosphoribosyltransferase
MAIDRDPLLTDHYQLTMLQAYLREGLQDTAVFEFFVRKLPRCRSFLIAAGLEQVLDWLEQLRFSADDIAWLKGTRRFDPAFLDWLAGLRFTGDVHAMPEGTVFFPDEPILRVTAPLPVAQLIESRVLNLLHYQTLIASKAARMVLLAPNAMLIDFGLRRAHGAEAGRFAARAAYIAGFAGTATVAAERAFGVPSFGTMAHSYILAHASERQAFAEFARAWPGNVILLIDTYDTLKAAAEVVQLTPVLAQEGIRIAGVRLDSGDLIQLAHDVRRLFDAAGLNAIRIVASSSVDEYLMAKAAAAGAPIDGYGIGTHLTTSADAPYLDCAYKLQEYAGCPRRKRSTGKATWPGRKQVFRLLGADGSLAGDLLTVEGEKAPGTALVQPTMRAGKRIAPPEPLATIRQRAADALRSLPERLRVLERPDGPLPYPVEVSDALRRLATDADALVDRAQSA